MAKAEDCGSNPQQRAIESSTRGSCSSSTSRSGNPRASNYRICKVLPKLFQSMSHAVVGAVLQALSKPSAQAH